MRFNDVLNAMVILAVLLIIGFVSGLQMGKSGAKRVTDTITTVQILERPVTIRDSIHTKSVTIRNRDTVYYLERPVEIPCGDTAFIAQADSVITATKDTINMAFSYANKQGYFSLVYRPRPDSIKVVQLPTVVEKETEWGWVLGALGIGIGFGVYYAKP